MGVDEALEDVDDVAKENLSRDHVVCDRNYLPGRRVSLTFGSESRGVFHISRFTKRSYC